jgi:hypothetical protein
MLAEGPKTKNKVVSDSNSPFADERADLPQTETSLLQFSLASMFVVTTLMALLLSTYFGVGRLIGMSTTEVLADGMRNFVFHSPLLLIWFVGLTVAVRRLKRDRRPAVLTLIALATLVLTSVVFQVTQMALIHMVRSNQIGHQTLSWAFMAIGGLHAILHAGCWVLILVAVFVGRSSDSMRRKPINPSDDPFQRSTADVAR